MRDSFEQAAPCLKCGNERKRSIASALDESIGYFCKFCNRTLTAKQNGALYMWAWPNTFVRPYIA